MQKIAIRIIFIFILLLLIFSCTGKRNDSQNKQMVTITDSLNREVTIPATVSRIICSGSGALRYITYMQCQDKVSAVDDLEKKRQQFDARPYALANPGFKELPLFGEYRGNDNPELIAALNPQPELIFKISGNMGYDPVDLQQKTGIPVVVIDYGDIGKNRALFYKTLDLIGKIMHKEKRAAAIKEFIDRIIADLDTRTRDTGQRKSCFIGGVAYKGAHGLQSTEPGYPPFLFLNTPNAAINTKDSELAHMDVSKESIVDWDPEILFIDLATMQSDPKANALYELKNDPAYKSLRAVQSGSIYGVLPYNGYSQNHESTLANAYYIGKVLYPDRFTDIAPAVKAAEIYTFFTGKAVFTEMSAAFGEMAYKKLEL